MFRASRVPVSRDVVLESRVGRGPTTAMRSREKRFVMNSTRRVAVITGTSQGIGAGLVRGFLDRGFRVVANSRSIEAVSSADMLTSPAISLIRRSPTA